MSTMGFTQRFRLDKAARGKEQPDEVNVNTKQISNFNIQ